MRTLFVACGQVFGLVQFYYGLVYVTAMMTWARADAQDWFRADLD